MQRTIALVRKKGSLENVNLETETLPEPDENEVQIEVHSIGLNFADLFAIQGLYSATPQGAFIPGLEYSGVVISTGKKVKNVKKKDKIMGVTRFGGYSSHLNIDSRYVFKLPSKWSFDQGAGFLVQGLTAYYALVALGDLKKGQTVLIHSAAGGVGILANRIAKKIGAFTIGTVGTSSKIDLLKKEGYDKQIVRSDRFKNDLQESLSGTDLNLVLECIGGKIFQESYEVMSPMGRMIVYGAAEMMGGSSSVSWPRVAYKYFSRPKLDPMKMVSDNKAVMGFNLIWLYEKVEILTKHLNALVKLNISPPLIGKTFAFDSLSEALKYFQSGTSMGKVVLKVKS
ncbi:MULTISPECIES: synaptic vesicle VAT-1 family membrane protein [Leptospira]|uniref:synaptic vesicle VAT-1 family membrane protein n=1 Tax=Leptospira TaxID=171 RepID=UPI0002BD88A5|nr:MULTISPECIES: medium chain dehydrogenase/reductase family protein [Leptospira]EMJ87295.1 oxidoreductase, zinc-binding dehydrogenase family protein [Leptospira kirschneri str. JB]EMK06941.1 oxidoreductase, zinc-binding dehydrogenase family protein [Leptospira kirschneri]KXZ24870.1 alcohol dehydrogenase [Leptospira kirschneri]KXZ33198.1 alcohol dehydrogenase [Leptospira sp. ZV016]